MGVGDWVKDNLGLGGDVDQAVLGALESVIPDQLKEDPGEFFSFGGGLDQSVLNAIQSIVPDDPSEFFRFGGTLDQAALGAVDEFFTPGGIFGGSGGPEIPEAARAVFDASNVNPYDEAGALRRPSTEQTADRQTQNIKLRSAAEDQAMWSYLNSMSRGGSAARTVVDAAQLEMMQSGISDALARGMEQLETQYTMMSEELTRQQELASDEIQRSRLAALDSMTQLQKDLKQRGSDAQASIMQSAARTGGGIAAATEQALSRLGTSGANVSAGIRRRLEEEGQVERDLASQSADIQSDLGARLSQISQGALDRQQGLVETTAQGSSAELQNLVAQINAQRASERAATEFELDEGARQRALELMLNPPTMKVGGRAAGPYAGQAALINAAYRAGLDPELVELGVVTGNLSDLLWSTTGIDADPPSNAEVLAPYLTVEQDEAAMRIGELAAEGKLSEAVEYGQVTGVIPTFP